jgi:hypothetical protein
MQRLHFREGETDQRECCKTSKTHEKRIDTGYKTPPVWPAGVLQNFKTHEKRIDPGYEIPTVMLVDIAGVCRLGISESVAITEVNGK